MTSDPLELLWSSVLSDAEHLAPEEPSARRGLGPLHTTISGHPSLVSAGSGPGFKCLGLKQKPLHFTPYCRIIGCWGLPIIWDNAYNAYMYIYLNQLLENVRAALPWIINSDHFWKNGVCGHFFLAGSIRHVLLSFLQKKTLKLKNLNISKQDVWG